MEEFEGASEAVLRKHAYHPEALAELMDAEDRYEAEVPGLGRTLQQAVEQSIDLIKRMPEIAPPWPVLDVEVTVRRMLLSRFQYALAYIVRDDVVIMVAVAHTSRKPGYWRERLLYQ